MFRKMFIFLLLSLFWLTQFLTGSLKELEKRVKRDLELIDYPIPEWRPQTHSKIYDVVIVGAGMAGLSAAFALMRQGITHIKLFDAHKRGFEGPWKTYALMKTLRSGKDFMGPALFVPSLTFHAWYEAKFGSKAWNHLKRSPTSIWMEYLKWYRKILGLDVQNNARLKMIVPKHNYFELLFKKETAGKQFMVHAHKVVLATGREGYGGLEIPPFVKGLSRQLYAHNAQTLKSIMLKDKHVVVVGCGASAFDAAAYALEHGASLVTMMIRRTKLPNRNKLAYLGYEGLFHGFHLLSDADRAKFYNHVQRYGVPVPNDSLKRLNKNKNVTLKRNIIISQAHEREGKVELVTNQGNFVCDYLVLATGFAIDGTRQPELKNIIHTIQHWKDRRLTTKQREQKLGNYPYLGDHFEFMEKQKGIAPYLKDLYCFNYAAILSHGPLASDILGISFGATRLAEGIAADFFSKNVRWHYNDLKKYSFEDFKEKDFPFLSQH